LFLILGVHFLAASALPHLKDSPATLYAGPSALFTCCSNFASCDSFNYVDCFR
jgi:hypothetical protein